MVHAILFSVFYSFIVLHYQGFMKSKLIVTNQTGQLVKTQTLDSDYQINLDDFTPGLYFIKLDSGRSAKYEKVVLE